MCKFCLPTSAELVALEYSVCQPTHTINYEPAERTQAVEFHQFFKSIKSGFYNHFLV